MSARSTLVRLLIQAGPVLAVLFAVGVLLAAIPAHRPPAVAQAAQQSQSGSSEMDHSKMPGMDMSDEKANEHAAMDQMSGHSHAEGAHMHMTAPRPQSAADTRR